MKKIYLMGIVFFSSGVSFASASGPNAALRTLITASQELIQGFRENKISFKEAQVKAYENYNALERVLDSYKAIQVQSANIPLSNLSDYTLAQLSILFKLETPAPKKLEHIKGAVNYTQAFWDFAESVTVKLLKAFGIDRDELKESDKQWLIEKHDLQMPSAQTRVAIEAALRKNNIAKNVVVLEKKSDTKYPWIKHPAFTGTTLPSFTPFLAITPLQSLNKLNEMLFSIYHEIGHIYHNHSLNARFVQLLCFSVSFQNLVVFYRARRGYPINRTNARLLNYVSMTELFYAVFISSYLAEKEADLFACEQLIKHNEFDAILEKFISVDEDGAIEREPLMIFRLLVQVADFIMMRVLERRPTSDDQYAYFSNCITEAFAHRKQPLLNAKTDLLAQAAENSSLETIIKLIKWGADVNKPNTLGEMPLDRAINRLEEYRPEAREEVRQIIKALQDAGAKHSSKFLEEAWHLYAAVKVGDHALVSKLIHEGIDVTKLYTKNYSKSVLLSHAPDAAMVDLLVAAGAEVNSDTPYLEQPLQSAIRRGLPEVAQALIKYGALLDAGNSDIQKAIEIPSFELVKILVDAGADVNYPDSDGNTPLDNATRRLNKLPIYLWWWVKKDLEQIVHILKDAGAKHAMELAYTY